MDFISLHIFSHPLSNLRRMDIFYFPIYICTQDKSMILKTTLVYFINYAYNNFKNHASIL